MGCFAPLTIRVRPGKTKPRRFFFCQCDYRELLQARRPSARCRKVLRLWDLCPATVIHNPVAGRVTLLPRSRASSINLAGDQRNRGRDAEMLRQVGGQAGAIGLRISADEGVEKIVAPRRDVSITSVRYVRFCRR